MVKTWPQKRQIVIFLLSQPGSFSTDELHPIETLLAKASNLARERNLKIVITAQGEQGELMRNECARYVQKAPIAQRPTLVSEIQAFWEFIKQEGITHVAIHLGATHEFRALRARVLLKKFRPQGITYSIKFIRHPIGARGLKREAYELYLLIRDYFTLTRWSRARRAG